MEIKLKSIYVSERLSRETTAFQATLYIDGVRAGVVANYGQGQADILRPADEKGASLMREARKWCRTLPALAYDHLGDGNTVMVEMDLEVYINSLVMDWLRRKDAKRFSKKMEKAMLTSILFGLPGKTFQEMKYRMAIATLIGMDKGIERLRLDIHKKVLPMLGKNEKILNTNIPAKTILLLEVPAGKWVDQ